MPRVSFGVTCWKTADTPLGSSFGGGRVICKSGGVAWIVALNTTEVTRTWYCRNDAVTTAQSISGCTGWFVPTCGQLQNPGYTCRTYWDFSSSRYWSSTDTGGSYACTVHMIGGMHGRLKTYTLCVRAFRCVTY